ncbi:MAG: GrpB family protein [Prevotella sp.]|nr:GrpB family protein [Staphylococcus sp.]MCM1349743.1 GrpB family protein [Prevotella sp.]
MEGVKRYQVRLLPHHTAWDSEFERVQKMLKLCWKEDIIDIQHVGSTAIPSICAKPILDVAVKVKSLNALDKEALVQKGYDDCGSQGGQTTHVLFVLRGPHQVSLQHIHCYDQADNEFDQLVGFRDYLNAHLEVALAYQTLKISLAEQYRYDRETYTRKKAPFILAIYRQLSQQSSVNEKR